MLSLGVLTTHVRNFNMRADSLLNAPRTVNHNYNEEIKLGKKN